MKGKLMSNAVTTRAAGGALAAAQALKSNLAKIRDELPQGGSSFLRFLQDGNWVFGKENHEVAKGKDEVAVNPLSIKTGWSCWTDYDERGKKNELIEEILVPLGTPKPLKHQLKDHGWEWRELVSADFKILSGPHKGKQVTFSTTSKGGVGMMRSLIDQILVQLDEDPANIVPVLVLDSGHYPHPKWGRTYTPAYELIEFISLDGEAMSDPEPEEEEAEEKPARRASKSEPEQPARRARKEEPEPEPEEVEEAEAAEEAEEAAEDQDEAPRRRRRR